MTPPEVIGARGRGGPAVAGRREAVTRLRVFSWLGAVGLSVAAITAFLAGAVGDSVALLMLGVDVAIIGFASVVLLARTAIKGPPTSDRLDGARHALAVQFFALAGLAIVDSVYAFVSDRHSDPGVFGISVLVAILLGSIALASETARLGNLLGSKAVRRQGADHLFIGALAAAVLAASLGVVVTELWVLDQLAALLVSAVALTQALECGRGEGWGLWRGDEDGGRGGGRT
jgi:divalent metal cation (Fe/Co/Zn/Cd) transporter